MKTKLIKLYTIFVSLIFIFSIFLFSFNIFSDYVHGEKNCENRFELLSLNLKKLTTKYNFYTQAFDNNLLEAVNPLEDFAYLKITKDYETYFLYENDENSKNNNSKFIHEQYFSFYVNDEIIHIDAKMFLVKQSSLIRYAFISFLIILITTIITFILIIINYNNSKNIILENDDNISTNDNNVISKNENQSEKNHEPKTADEILASIDYSKTKLDLPLKTETKELTQEIKTEAFTTEKSQNIENNQTEENIVETKEEVCPLSENINQPASKNEIPAEQKVQNEIIDSNEKVSTNNNQSENVNQTDESTTSEITPKTELPSEEVKPLNLNDENIDEPKGLFSEQTGLGWESYLSVRLENELNRAISSEIDLALFIIKLPCLEKNDKIFKDIVDYLCIQFQFKDLLFEYKNDSIAAIKINTNVDEALTFAEKLQYDINELLKDYPSKCFIGISTRTVRMMSAERLIKEADEALIHAQDDDDCQIIAFRADAAKYRQFIENN